MLLGIGTVLKYIYLCFLWTVIKSARLWFLEGLGILPGTEVQMLVCWLGASEHGAGDSGDWKWLPAWMLVNEQDTAVTSHAGNDHPCHSFLEQGPNTLED